MLLHTPAYLAFLTLVVVIYWLIGRRAWQNWLLLLSSYLFYLFFDVRFVILLCVLSVVTYYLGQNIRKHPPRARLYLCLGIVVNLGALGVLKYLNFFLESASAGLRLLGVQTASPILNLLLPVGLSFYIFQAISYLTEIHAYKIEPAQRFVDLSVYLAFFPKLVAGPIVKPGDFLQQLDKPRQINRRAVMSGLGLLLLGLFRKIVIADSIASMADAAFIAASKNNGTFSTPLYMQGFYLYAFQIYADFSGYTDIARASAVLLGFKLPQNFREPYFASTISDFWNRWHLSLTQWFRENLFFPLSRALLRNHSHRPRAVQVVANLVTMTLIGLWHGAAWTFIGWGLWHGVLLSVNSILNIRPTRPRARFVSGLISFHLVGTGWVLFRVASFSDAINFFKGLISFQQMAWLPFYLPSVALAAALVFGIDVLNATAIGHDIRRKQGLVLAVCGVVAVVCLMLLAGTRGGDTRTFIYGQF